MAESMYVTPWWPVLYSGFILIKPLINGIISFGLEILYMDNERVFNPASGWVWTKGSNGVKNWEGETLWGNQGTHHEVWYTMPTWWDEYWYYKGVTGFTGISITGLSGIRFFGIASHVAIATEFPG